MLRKGTILALFGLVAALVACTPAVAPSPSSTTAPVAAPTKAPETIKPAVAPTTAPAAVPTPRPATLKMGTIQALNDAGVYLAIDKGHFKEQGITVEFENFRNSAEMIAPLGTGQLDFLGTTLSVSLLAAADRGIDFKIVADKGMTLPKWEASWIVLRKDLADSGQVKTGADLKGMKVAVPSPGSLGEQTVNLLLEQSGLKPGDVEIVVLPFAEQAAAFGNKAIAASYSSEPFIARGIQEGFSVKWIPNSKFFDGKTQTATIIYGSALLKDRDLAQRWMVAYLKGVRDYLKAFTTKEGRNEVVNILVKYSTVKDPKLYDVMEMPYLDPNGGPDKKSMESQFKWFVDKGLYAGKKTFADIVDLSYAEYATQKLGKQ